MSVADKRRFAAAIGGNVGAQIGYSATTQAGLERGLKKGGVVGAAASGLGITLSAEEKKKYGLSKAGRASDAMGEDTDAAAEFFATRLGVEGGGSDVLQGKVKSYLANLRTGNTGTAGERLQGIMSDKEVIAAQGKKKEEEDETSNPLAGGHQAQHRAGQEVSPAHRPVSGGHEGHFGRDQERQGRPRARWWWRRWGSSLAD